MCTAARGGHGFFPPIFVLFERADQKLVQATVQLVVSGQQLGIGNSGRTATIVGHKTARFTHDQAARGGIPGRQSPFPKTVIATCRQSSEIKACCTETPDTGDFGGDGGVNLAPFLDIAMSFERNAGRNQSLAQLATRRHAQPLMA